MTDRPNQIIPNPQSVVRYLDPKIVKIMDSHSVFTIDEIFKKIDPSLNRLLSNKQSDLIFKQAQPGNCNLAKLVKDINEAISPLSITLSTEQSDIFYEKMRTDPRYGSPDFIKTIFFESVVTSVISILIDGTDILLLQPDAKGWQKGSLKICFEFTPEGGDSIINEEKSIEPNLSPLDEIRQLANELTAMTSIEQN
jgi:KGK domain